MRVIPGTTKYTPVGAPCYLQDVAQVEVKAYLNAMKHPENPFHGALKEEKRKDSIQHVCSLSGLKQPKDLGGRGGGGGGGGAKMSQCQKKRRQKEGGKKPHKKQNKMKKKTKKQKPITHFRESCKTAKHIDHWKKKKNQENNVQAEITRM